MKKKNKPKKKGFDELFDTGKVGIDFSGGVVTKGLSKTVKLPPLDVPGWLGLMIDRIAEFQANSRASVVRQLLVEAIESRRRRFAA
jgi:hypothetical protein